MSVNAHFRMAIHGMSASLGFLLRPDLGLVPSSFYSPVPWWVGLR